MLCSCKNTCALLCCVWTALCLETLWLMIALLCVFSIVLSSGFCCVLRKFCFFLHILHFLGSGGLDVLCWKWWAWSLVCACVASYFVRTFKDDFYWHVILDLQILNESVVGKRLLFSDFYFLARVAESGDAFMSHPAVLVDVDWHPHPPPQHDLITWRVLHCHVTVPLDHVIGLDVDEAYSLRQVLFQLHSWWEKATRLKRETVCCSFSVVVVVLPRPPPHTHTNFTAS